MTNNTRLERTEDNAYALVIDFDNISTEINPAAVISGILQGMIEDGINGMTGTGDKVIGSVTLTKED